MPVQHQPHFWPELLILLGQAPPVGPSPLASCSHRPPCPVPHAASPGPTAPPAQPRRAAAPPEDTTAPGPLPTRRISRRSRPRQQPPFCRREAAGAHGRPVLRRGSPASAPSPRRALTSSASPAPAPAPGGRGLPPAACHLPPWRRPPPHRCAPGDSRPEGAARRGRAAVWPKEGRRRSWPPARSPQPPQPPWLPGKPARGRRGPGGDSRLVAGVAFPSSGRAGRCVVQPGRVGSRCRHGCRNGPGRLPSAQASAQPAAWAAPGINGKNGNSLGPAKRVLTT